MTYNPADLVGIILPVLIDLINKDVQNPRLSYLISLVVCILAGIALNLDKINNWPSLVANIGAVVISAQLMFHLYYQQSHVRQSLSGS